MSLTSMGPMGPQQYGIGCLMFPWIFFGPFVLFIWGAVVWMQSLASLDAPLYNALTDKSAGLIFSGTAELAPGAPRLFTPDHHRPAIAVALEVDEERAGRNGDRYSTPVTNDFRVVPFLLKTPQGSYAVPKGFTCVEPKGGGQELSHDREIPTWALQWETGRRAFDPTQSYDVTLATLAPGQAVTVIGKVLRQGNQLAIGPGPDGYRLVDGDRHDLMSRIHDDQQHWLWWAIGAVIWLVGLKVPGWLVRAF